MKSNPRQINSVRNLWLGWLVALLQLPLVVFAQERGTITGQVVAEDGKAISNLGVSLSASGADRSRSTTTDETGHFQFNNLPDRNYFVSASSQKGYVPKPMTAEERRQMRVRPGASLTITMIRGGVITGRITNANGDPQVSISVAAIRVRDQEGNKTGDQANGLPRTTDDRGVYRIYGLYPGTYIVVANSNPSFFTSGPSPYFGEVPTFHPSSTRDTAAEVKVTSGDEVSGIDIRYRGGSGHVVSGKVLGITGAATMNSGAAVTLRHAVTNATVSSAIAQPGQEDASFAIYGISEGDYEVMASRGGFESEDVFYSEPRRITVKGADVTGINLRLTPAAMVTGHLAVEKSPTVCDAKLKPVIEDLSVAIRRDENGETNSSVARLYFSRVGTPDQKGDFKITGIWAGRYRFQAGLPNETWFIKSISGPAPIASGRPAAAKSVITVDLTRGSLPLKPGEKYSGATITVTDGGATLRGKVVPAKEGAKLTQRLQVHLVPAELTAVNDTLRFTERVADRDGAFTFVNITPGKYWLLARALPDDDPTNRPPQPAAWPAAWDANSRAKLLKDAEAAKNEIELKACQRVKDHVLRF